MIPADLDRYRAIYREDPNLDVCMAYSQGVLDGFLDGDDGTLVTEWTEENALAYARPDYDYVTEQRVAYALGHYRGAFERGPVC
jgi:hypothetical protein